ncbi:MAG TPA: aminotransferase class V-fold PLP-dependent enzyme [Mycobacteriales bacterium]|jgi:glutamate/tyrosine decarboxylase-like PLP-dependent enzyme|nr:aminotransferase class V-fold PLP-dependent enzyme [Mycobacteriales bacterium]
MAETDWDWGPEELRAHGHRMVDLLVEHLSTLPEQPVFRPYPRALAQERLSAPLPELGRPAGELFDELAGTVLPWPFGNGHPRWAGWVNGPPSPVAVLADALAAAMNPSVAGGNHAATYVEKQVVRWLGELLGLPGWGGLLVSGGSAATVHALAAARHRATAGAVRQSGLDQSTAPLTVYASDQTHSAVAKAVELLGLGAAALRVLPADRDRRLPVAALASALASDRARGARPMAVVASAGTVNTGAIDPLAEIGSLCAAERVWLHVDGAYGAPAVLDPRHAAALAPMAAADSVAVDAHKWLSVPYEAGAVLVRDEETLRAAFSRVAAYLAEDSDPDGVTWLPWFSEYGSQQTRGFRALKVWAALAHHGRSGYATTIGHDLDLAERLAATVDRSPLLTLVSTGLSVVTFRSRASDDREVLRRVQLGGEAFLTGTALDGGFVLRACITNPRMRAEDVDRIVAAVEAAARP